MKVSDFITCFFISKNIKKCFSVTGGFAMHLNDSFGEKLDVTYTHGENPAGYAAVGWSSVEYNPSVCCVTSGAGATNAITPCLIAFQDSVPVFFISGQVHSTDNIRSLGGKHRGYFGSDCDIVECVRNITKFSYELVDPSETLKVLEECYYNLTTGRLGPVWLSVPVDIQSKEICDNISKFVVPCEVEYTIPNELYELCKKAEKPLVLAGNGIHLSKTEKEFQQFLDISKIPFVVSFFGSDLGNGEYTGKVGIIGNRSGNFAIQNADLIICLGCRLSKSITGYNRDIFSPQSKIIYVDIDPCEFLEMKKIDLKIICDLNHFFTLNLNFKNMKNKWIENNIYLKQKWSHELPEKKHNKVCIYRHLKNFFNNKQENSIVVASAGSLFCVTWHMYKYKTNDRFICSSHGDMGYEIPVSIGSVFHNKKRTFCLVGDGAFHFNFQELETIKFNNLPITVMIFNNNGYGAIKITQNTIFKNEYGINSDSSLSFSNIEKIANVYNLKYFSITDENDFSYLTYKDGPCIVEIFCEVQERFPKLSNKFDEKTQKFINLPFDDMFPHHNQICDLP